MSVEKVEQEQQSPNLREGDIVEISSWADMEGDPLLVRDVEADSVAVGKVIGHYEQLFPLQPCCIKTCHAEHGTGWYVELSSGRRTFIGHMCGNTHFPHLKDQIRIFRRVDTRKRARKRVTRCLESLDRLEPQILEFIEREGRAVYQAMQPFLMMTAAPRELVHELLRRQRTSTVGITTERARTPDEVKDYKIINPSAKGRDLTHETIPLGVLDGLDALKTNRIQRLVRAADKRRRKLEELDLDRDSVQKINTTAAECEGLEIVLEAARKVVNSFHKFVQPKNISLFEHLVEGCKDRVGKLQFSSEKGWN